MSLSRAPSVRKLTESILKDRERRSQAQTLIGWFAIGFSRLTMGSSEWALRRLQATPRYRRYAAELVALAPDVILVNGPSALAQVQQATRIQVRLRDEDGCTGIHRD